MAHAEKTMMIPADLGAVFSFIADGLNNPKWRPGVLDISLRSGRAGEVGSEYRQKMRGPGGRTVHGDYRIVRATKNEEVAFEVITGPARPTGLYRFRSVPGGTEVTFSLDFQPRGIARMMNGMIQKTMEAEVGNLANIAKAM
jgi:uncharacterized membrane protein